MSILNAYKQLQGGNSIGPQKQSLLFIQQAIFHRIQIKSISSMYKLSVKLKKPIIFSFYTLPVLKHILYNSQILKSIYQMQNIYEIKINVAGYGIFNQKYQLQQLSTLFLILAEYCKNISLSLKKLSLQFPGWRTFDKNVLTNIFKFVKKCQSLDQFFLNVNHAMCLQNNQENLAQSSNNLSQQNTFYGKYSFGLQQFDLLMKYVSSLLPKNTLTKLQLRFSVWKCVNTEVLQILILYLKKLYQRLKNLRILKIDLNGWGSGDYQSSEKQMKQDKLVQFFRGIQQFDSQSLQILELDMRNWPSKYKKIISSHKQKFQYLSGSGKRKEETNTNTNTGVWSMSVTNFYYSALKSKMAKRIKIQIID